MSRKHKRAEMTFTDTTEIEAFDAVCAKLGYSRSDALRQAVNVAYKMNWTVPLWRRSEAKITASGRSKRRARSKNNDT